MSPEEYMRTHISPVAVLEQHAPPRKDYYASDSIGKILTAKVMTPKASDISLTLEERGARYGKFIDHSKISQGLQDVMREAPNWDTLDVDMRQALTTIVDKIARILNGDPYYSDSWHDVSGYATLVERRLLELEKAKQ